MSVLKGIKPYKVMGFFEEICAIPHGSGNMEKISDYCMQVAKNLGLEAARDKMNNVVIKKSASKGYEDRPTVVLQAHLDMVCEKERDCNIDFEKEGITLLLEGDWITAKGTTLGGDDGIGVAMILAILADDSLPHPPIEALFTVDEEIGLLGADGLNENLITGRKMINIDMEEEGILTVSCAGGAVSKITLPALTETPKYDCYEVIIDGLKGGHSGVEINSGRLNSNILMGKFLSQISGEYNIISVFGGNKDNAIPSSTVMEISISSDLLSLAESFEKNNRTELEKDLKVRVKKIKTPKKCFDKSSSKTLTKFLSNIKNGVQKMSHHIENLPETSLNLGILRADEKGIEITVSVRSSVNKEKLNLLNWLKDYAQSFGGESYDSGHYPAWEYRKDSPLRDTMVSVYENLYSKKPRVEAIHAGLECGILSEKLEGLDAVSFGPDVREVHSPKEKLSISSVERSFNYLCKVLEKI